MIAPTVYKYFVKGTLKFKKMLFSSLLMVINLLKSCQLQKIFNVIYKYNGDICIDKNCTTQSLQNNHMFSNTVWVCSWQFYNQEISPMLVLKDFKVVLLVKHPKNLSIAEKVHCHKMSSSEHSQLLRRQLMLFCWFSS